MTSPQLSRYVAFSTDPAGGNPAGVWVGDVLPSPAEMQQIAPRVGYSETAFLAPVHGAERTVRYYSPEAEVPFCGHATIAAGAALGAAEGEGTYWFATQVGVVPVTVHPDGACWNAALTSVEPLLKPVSNEVVDEALRGLHWKRADLDPAIPPALAYAGEWHLVLAVCERDRLRRLDYDFEALAALSRRAGFITAQLIWRAQHTVFHARNPFPAGGIVEDPATGAAAAALGGYLREAGLISPPTVLTIHQGEDMGRPSEITVEVPVVGGLVVSGAAVQMEGAT
ncbi:MAG: PhzF family phenazine biosynthesis protein [Bacteroidota bacterium]